MEDLRHQGVEHGNVLWLLEATEQGREASQATIRQVVLQSPVQEIGKFRAKSKPRL